MIGRRWFLALAGLATMGAMALGCDNGGTTEVKPDSSGGTAAAAAEWKVGAYLSLSGAETQFGTDTKEGIELATDEINAAGGVRGRKLKVLYEDNKSNAQETTNKVLQLIQRDKVVALLGEVASSRSRAGGIVANREKVPMITPSSTHPDVTKIGPFVFRVCFTDDLQGKAGASFIKDTLHKSKVAIFYASDDLYSSGLAKEFRDEWVKQGGSIAIEKSFLKTESNFTTYLNEIKGAGVEAIYAPIYYNAMVNIARQAKAAGIPGNMFVGGDGWDADQLLKDAGDEMEGAYFTNHYAPDVPWPNSQKFVAKYKDRFKRDPSSLAAMGYDAAKVLADSIGRAKGDTPQAIRDAIAETKGFEGATGNITINAERNADKPMVIVQIKEKRFAYFAVVGGSAPAPAPSAAAPAESAAPAAGSAAPAAGSAAPAAGSAAPTK